MLIITIDSIILKLVIKLQEITATKMCCRDLSPNSRWLPFEPKRINLMHCRGVVSICHDGIAHRHGTVAH